MSALIIVDDDFKAHKTLRDTIENRHMQWVEDFMSGGPNHEDKYIENLKKVKRSMRADVYDIGTGIS
jgi:hypothetical protein